MKSSVFGTGPARLGARDAPDPREDENDEKLITRGRCARDYSERGKTAKSFTGDK